MDRKVFFSGVRAEFGPLSQEQVDWIEAILDAFVRYGDGDGRKLAYIFSTAWHETGRFRWLVEIWGPTAAQKRYEGRRDLGNVRKGDGKKFMGRGPVMLTGRRNYTDWSKRLGVDLVKEPALASEPDIGARILVHGSMLGTFTGKKLGDYIGPDGADYRNARRVVNGTDKAEKIARYALAFEDALKAAGYAPKAKEPPIPADRIDRPDERKSPLAAFLAALIAIGAAIAAYLNGWGPF